MPAKGKADFGSFPEYFFSPACLVFKIKNMKVFVNNEAKEFDGKRTVSQLIEVLGLSRKGMALAVNNAVVSKSDWEKFKLNENDKVTIIKATQGG